MVNFERICFASLVFCCIALRRVLTSFAMRCDHFQVLSLTAKIAVSWKFTHTLKSRLSFHQSYGRNSLEVKGLHPSCCILLTRQGQSRFCPSTCSKMGSTAAPCGNDITQKILSNNFKLKIPWWNHMGVEVQSNVKGSLWYVLKSIRRKEAKIFQHLTKMRVYSLACHRFLPQWFLPEILLICFLNCCI